MPNLTSASQNLYELIQAQSLVAYPDADLRLAIQRSVAVENARGWRIAKEKSSHKIDVVVALAQAALAAVHRGEQGWMRMGVTEADGVGRLTWLDEEPQLPRIRLVTVNEFGDELTTPEQVQAVRRGGKS